MECKLGALRSGVGVWPVDGGSLQNGRVLGLEFEGIARHRPFTFLTYGRHR